MVPQVQVLTVTSPELVTLLESSLQTVLERLGYNNSPPPEADPPPDKPVDVKELCDFLNVTEVTIIRHRKKGLIPFYQIGSKILYNKKAVLDALQVRKNK